MKQEDKELLLQDLCRRFPYGVKISKVIDNFISEPHQIRSINSNNVIIEDGEFEDGTPDIDVWDIENIKPYLFPLSSMTEEQKEEYGKYYDIDLANSAKNLYNRLDGKDTINGYPMYNHIDWCNKNHFDYRGLIPMGLATDATGLNIY